jgi:hypothetical protein
MNSTNVQPPPREIAGRRVHSQEPRRCPAQPLPVRPIHRNTGLLPHRNTEPSPCRAQPAGCDRTRTRGGGGICTALPVKTPFWRFLAGFPAKPSSRTPRECPPESAMKTRYLFLLTGLWLVFSGSGTTSASPVTNAGPRSVAYPMPEQVSTVPLATLEAASTNGPGGMLQSEAVVVLSPVGSGGAMLLQSLLCPQPSALNQFQLPIPTLRTRRWWSRLRSARIAC